jgi:ABC-type uncharacterized transport system substrate-binding protein
MRCPSILPLLLALSAACGGQPDAKNAGMDQDTAGAAGSGDRALVAIVRAADWMGREWSEDAIKLGLRESDMEEGRDYEFKISSAQGDLATLPSLLDAALDGGAKVIVTLQDATLQAAVQRVKSVPVIFNLLSDPFAAGAGTSDDNHLPNVTGVYSPGFGDPEQMDFKDRLTKAAGKAGLKVTAVPVSNVAEVGEATRTLCSKKVDAIELFGNAAHAGFAGLIKIARECKLPVFSPSPFEVLQGAVASFYPDFQEGGVEAGKMIARVLRGESPAKIPFHRLKTTKTVVNQEGAAKLGLPIPPEVVKEADSVIGGAPKP